MAENLNVPADFAKPKIQVSKLTLLPPSAFESKPSRRDPWREISKTEEELRRLKFENEQLREAQKKALAEQVSYTHQSQIQEPSARQTIASGVCHHPTQGEGHKYIDELISKQATEISDLKNELRAQKCQHRDEVAEIERLMCQKERDHAHRITSLEDDLKTAEDRYDIQVDRLSREHQRETDEMRDAIDKLQEEVTQGRLRSGEKIDDLEMKYAQLKQTSSERVDGLIHDLRSKECLIENQNKQINQLKKYIGETENLLKPVEISKREKDSLSSKLKMYESECENMRSTIQLLNIRLNSTNEILKLQETELSKTSSETEKSKNEAVLLTRWREKVFALMVQQKSSEISCKKDESNWKAKVCDVEKKLSSAHNRIEQLSHCVSDRDAQLDLERNTCQRLQGELSEAQQCALCLDDRVQGNVQMAQSLQEFTASVWSKFQENLDILNTAMSSMKAYENRVSFASSRVEMLQGLFARREARLKLQIDNGNIPEKEILPERIQEPDAGSGDGMHMRSELHRVTGERDKLAAQIREDSQMWDDKIISIRKQVEDEMNQLKQSKEDLEHIVQEKSQKCLELSDKYEICQNDLDYTRQTIEELKETIAKQEMNVEQLLEDQRREIESHCADRFADMDRQINEAKREQAKTVVSLRQVERQAIREKERYEEHTRTMEEHYTRQLTGLQEQLRVMERERNLMMATLRQEGLIGKMRDERGQPMTSSLVDTDEEPLQDKGETTPGILTPRLESDSQTVPEEPMASVLKDLESLTDAVLKDDDSSDTGSDIES